MTVDTQQLLAKNGSIAPPSPSRLQEIRDRAFHRMDDRATRGQHIHITANEAIELVAAAQALNDAQAMLDAQAAEIERLNARCDARGEQIERLRHALDLAEKSLLEVEHMVGGGDDEINLEPAILTARAALSGEPT